jgi:hypothetical protein
MTDTDFEGAMCSSLGGNVLEKCCSFEVFYDDDTWLHLVEETTPHETDEMHASVITLDGCWPSGSPSENCLYEHKRFSVALQSLRPARIFNRPSRPSSHDDIFTALPSINLNTDDAALSYELPPDSGRYASTQRARLKNVGVDFEDMHLKRRSRLHQEATECATGVKLPCLKCRRLVQECECKDSGDGASVTRGQPKSRTSSLRPRRLGGVVSLSRMIQLLNEEDNPSPPIDSWIKCFAK